MSFSFRSLRGRALKPWKENALLRRFLSSGSDDIKVPNRIERGPTDLLRALASTIGTDRTAAPYKYHDDPYLIPYSNPNKRAYALSQEAGRKAAYWVRQEHSDLFQHRVSVPFIEAFAPKVVYDENSEVTVDDLKAAIATHSVSNAQLIFEKLRKEDVEVESGLMQALLELMCYYNCRDPLSEDWHEERWYISGFKDQQMIKNEWKDNCFAELLFKSMKPDPKSYSAIICGMAKHGQVDMAFKYFEEAKEKRIQVSLSCYNHLISRVFFLKQSHDLAWQLIVDLMGDIKQSGYEPSLKTFNSALESLSTFSHENSSKEYALKVIAEMKATGCEPSLASYYFLLNIFYPNRKTSVNILESILDHIEGESFSVHDIRDVRFFVRAMEVAHLNLKNVEIAYKLDRLLHTGDNYNFIGSSYQ